MKEWEGGTFSFPSVFWLSKGNAGDGGVMSLSLVAETNSR